MIPCKGVVNLALVREPKFAMQVRLNSVVHVLEFLLGRCTESEFCQATGQLEEDSVLPVLTSEAPLLARL